MENENNIPVSAIKGFCTLPACWQYLHDIATALEPMHRNGTAHGNINVATATLKNGHFYPGEGTLGAGTESDIWQLAASAMELMLGSPIFNGKGEKAMKADTPIPLLPHQDADRLNSMLCKCLAYDKGMRPTATHIAECAKEEMERLAGKERRQKPIQAMTKRETTDKYERQWPEAIKASLAKTIALLLFVMAGSLSSQAQVLEQRGEETLITLRNAVLLLNNSDKSSWEEAQNEFGRHLNSFTLMDELQDSKNDCVPIASKVKKRGVNRLVTELKNGHRVQNSENELLDGSDSRFNYSIFEKCIKEGATSTYTMKGRSGKQVYLVIPYDSGNKYSCRLILAGNRVYAPSHTDKDGIAYFFIDSDEGPKSNEPVALKISNEEKNKNASFVIINHNYRDR